jgi:ectoine hydroxylase-related dioxygenase (phytanoyl-CoA dioxygenase family)
MEMPRVDAAATFDRVHDVLHTSGAVVVEGVLTEGEADRISEELAVWRDGSAPGGDPDKHPFMADFFGRRTRRFTGLSGRSPEFVSKILLTPILNAAARRTLLPDCEGILLNTAQAMIVGPGQVAQYLHRDEENWLPYRPPTGHEIVLGSMWAISDFIEANGATRVVPVSHTWERSREAGPTEILQSTMAKGSVLLYLGSLIHGAGANDSAEWRFGLHVSFLAGWLRPEENHFLTVPPGDAARLPAAARALLGYESYGEVARLGLVDFDPVG